MVTKNEFKKIHDQYLAVTKMIDDASDYIRYDSEVFNQPLILFDYCMESLFDDEALDVFYTNLDATFEELWDAMKDGRL